MQGGGPNDTSFGPQIHFFLFVYPLTVSSLIRVYTNDTHRRELLLAGWILPRPPTTMVMMTWCHRRRQLLYSKRQHRREPLLAGWVPTLAPDDDNDNDLVSSLSAPVLEGARNCGSSQIQELHTGAVAFNPFFVTILLMNKYYDFVSIKVSIS